MDYAHHSGDGLVDSSKFWPDSAHLFNRASSLADLAYVALPGLTSRVARNRSVTSLASLSDSFSDFPMRESPVYVQGGLSRPLVSTVCVVLFSSLMHGFNCGNMSTPAASIRASLGVPPTVLTVDGVSVPMPANDSIWAFAVCIFCLGALVGCHASAQLADRWGRKTFLLWNTVMFVVGSLLEAASVMPDCQLSGGWAPCTTRLGVLIAGRIVSGIASGGVCVVVPTYLGEIAPAHLRGALGTLSHSFTAAGLLLGQLLGLPTVLGSVSGWPLLLGTVLVPATLQLLLQPMLYESPRWYAMLGNDRMAELLLVSLRDRGLFDHELQEELYCMVRGTPTAGASRQPTPTMGPDSRVSSEASFKDFSSFGGAGGAFGGVCTGHLDSGGKTSDSPTPTDRRAKGRGGGGGGGAGSNGLYNPSSGLYSMLATPLLSSAASNGGNGGGGGGGGGASSAGGASGAGSCCNGGGAREGNFRAPSELLLSSGGGGGGRGGGKSDGALTRTSSNASLTGALAPVAAPASAVAKAVATQPAVRRAVLVCVPLLLVQQLCGFANLVSFSSIVLRQHGFDDAAIAQVVGWFGGANLVVATLSGSLMDRFGRRPLLLASLLIMGVGLGMLTVVLASTDNEIRPLAASFAAAVTAGGYGVGLGPVVALLPAELLPAPHRASGSGVAWSVVWLTQFFAAAVFLLQANALGTQLLLPHVGVLALGLVFALLVMPETRGKSLQAIEYEMSISD